MNPAEDYILKQEEPYKTILLQLQTIIEAVVLEAEMLYKWRIPVFYNNGIPICYLNKSKDYVDLAFWHRDKMQKYKQHFVTENRKSVASLRYRSLEEINDEVIVYALKEQLRINTNPYKTIHNSIK